MMLTETLLLSGYQVRELLTIKECIAAVENSFKLYAEGKAPAPAILGVYANDGGFHIKAGMMNLGKNYFVAKTNANFPGNTKKNGLPTIQGVITVCDADNGRLLALMDSIEITIIRTGAATAVAAKYLALPNAKTITICGAGNQGRISLKAIMQVRQLEKVFVFDIDNDQAERFAKEMSVELKISVSNVDDLQVALHQSDICVTCTTATKHFIEANDIMPGTLIAAVGADSEHKQEIQPELIASCKLVVDITEQASRIGELHHALQAKLTTIDKVHAELGEIITGKKAGRQTEDEIIIFDSTGTALQDVVAAAIVYEKAVENNIGMKFNFNESKKKALENNQIEKDQKMKSALMNFYPFR